MDRPASCPSPQENQPRPALLVGTLSPWPRSSSQLPASPGLAASSHSPANPASLQEGLPSPSPAHGGTKSSMVGVGGRGWGRRVPSGITSPPGTPLRLRRSLHPKPPHTLCSNTVLHIECLVCTRPWAQQFPPVLSFCSVLPPHNPGGRSRVTSLLC